VSVNAVYCDTMRSQQLQTAKWGRVHGPRCQMAGNTKGWLFGGGVQVRLIGAGCGCWDRRWRLAARRDALMGFRCCWVWAGGVILRRSGASADIDRAGRSYSSAGGLHRALRRDKRCGVCTQMPDVIVRRI